MWGRWLSFVMPENKMKGDINEKHKLLSGQIYVLLAQWVNDTRHGEGELTWVTGRLTTTFQSNMIISYLFVQFVQLAEQFKVARVCKGLCEDNFSDKLNFSMKLCNNATSWNRILISQNILDPTCRYHICQKNYATAILGLEIY